MSNAHGTSNFIRAFDHAHIWHPYAAMPNDNPVYPVASAQGCRLRLRDGRELVDGMSSWWAAIHGYNHPRLNAALHEQIERMAHVMFGGLTHEPAVTLAKALIDITPASLNTVFFCDSGSVAVEVAIKTAIQYWFSQGKSGKQRLLTVRGGYHGDTFGAMAVCDPVAGMHHIFSRVLTSHLFAPPPPPGYRRPVRDGDLVEFSSLLDKHHNEIAAVILEPIVQGAGGMRFYAPGYLQRVRELCDEYNVLLILDEIATGFGRSGRMFGCEHAGVQPDIMCIGKAMTGGYLSMAAMLCADRVVEGIHEGRHPVLMHGPTFMANPLACAVAAASIEELTGGPWKARVDNIEASLNHRLSPLRDVPHVADVRVLGAIGVVEMVRPVDMRRITEFFVGQGVWLRPFERLVYTMPPYGITVDELERVTAAIIEAAASAEHLTSG